MSALLHHPDSTLSGTVTFRAPNAYTSVAIGARMVDLVNAGRDPELPKLHPTELPMSAYRAAYMIATLEHVVETGPRGLFRETNGKPEIDLGRLDEFELTEDDGVIVTLYAAYEAWRDRFRDARKRAVAGTDAA